MRRFLLLASAVLSACGSAPETVSVVPENELEIAARAQASWGEIRIGAGNIWEERYTTGQGERREGLTAGLWLSFPEAPDRNRHQRVHPGARVAADPYLIEVLAVTESGVTVRVTEPPPGS